MFRKVMLALNVILLDIIVFHITKKACKIFTPGSEKAE